MAFLDCDLGQPELTLSGQVSLHILENPLLGPPFTHLKDATHSIYIGSSSPKHDPDIYTAAILNLWTRYLQFSASHPLPLVINTDGWVKGKDKTPVNSLPFWI